MSTDPLRVNVMSRPGRVLLAIMCGSLLEQAAIDPVAARFEPDSSQLQRWVCCFDQTVSGRALDELITGVLQHWLQNHTVPNGNLGCSLIRGEEQHSQHKRYQ